MASEGISVTESGTAYVGKDAVNLFRAKQVAIALRAFARTGMVMTRGYGPKKLLAAAASYLPANHKFAATKKGCEGAAAKVEEWHANMLSALPVEINGVPLAQKNGLD